MAKGHKTEPENPIDATPLYQPVPTQGLQAADSSTPASHQQYPPPQVPHQHYPAVPTYQPFMVTAQMNNNMQGDGTGQFLLRRPASTNDRFIINFYPAAWCGKAKVFDEEMKTTVPPILAARGISNGQWVGWMSDFEKAILSSDLSICASLGLAFSFIGWPYVCYANNTQARRVQVVIDHINRELEPKGLFFKTQTAQVHIDDYHEQVSWIAIALHPDAARVLKAESHILYAGCGSYGPLDCCTAFWGCIFCCNPKPIY